MIYFGSIFFANMGGGGGQNYLHGRPGYLTMEMNGEIMEEVLRRTSLVPLAFPSSVHGLIGVETEGRLDFQGRAGIISTVRWNLHPVIFGVRGVVHVLGQDS